MTFASLPALPGLNLYFADDTADALKKTSMTEMYVTRTSPTER